MRALVFLTNFLSFGTMFVFALLGFGCVKHRIQNWSKHLTFTDTVLDTEGTAAEVLPDLDATLEVRHRVWWPFWDGLIVKGYSGEAAHRLAELKNATVNDGLAKVKQHWAGEADAEFRKWRGSACDEVEGVDVFWDGETRHGHAAPGTKFGKMWVKRYPFECTVVFDEECKKKGAHDVAFLDSPDDVARLVMLNRGTADGEVQRIKLARRTVRAQVGQQFPLEAHVTISKRVPDGTHTETTSSTDSDGNTTTSSHEVQDYSTISVPMTFKVGTLALASHNDSKPMQAGFRASLHYTDGFGQAVKPNTGQMAVFTNEPWTMDHAMLVGGELHVGGRARGDGRLYEMLGNGDPVTEEQLAAVEEAAQTYRATMRAAFDAKEAVLPSSFWYMVYANDDLTKEGLAEWLAGDYVDYDGDGQAGEIFDIMSAHEQGLNYLFVRMSLARINEVAALWIGFFDSLWSNNLHIEEIAANAALLDPKQRTALAYRPMDRAALEEALRASDPPVLTSGGSSKLVCPALLDALYAELEKRSQPVAAQEATAVVQAGDLESVLVVQGEEGAGAEEPPLHPASSRFVAEGEHEPLTVEAHEFSGEEEEEDAAEADEAAVEE